MVLDYLGIRREYGWLSRVLETTAIGTPFSHLEKLKDALGVGIERGENGTLARLNRSSIRACLSLLLWIRTFVNTL